MERSLTVNKTLITHHRLSKTKDKERKDKTNNLLQLKNISGSNGRGRQNARVTRLHSARTMSCSCADRRNTNKLLRGPNSSFSLISPLLFLFPFSLSLSLKK